MDFTYMVCKEKKSVAFLFHKDQATRHHSCPLTVHLRGIQNREKQEVF